MCLTTATETAGEIRFAINITVTALHSSLYRHATILFWQVVYHLLHQQIPQLWKIIGYNVTAAASGENWAPAATFRSLSHAPLPVSWSRIIPVMRRTEYVFRMVRCMMQVAVRYCSLIVNDDTKTHVLQILHLIKISDVLYRILDWSPDWMQHSELYRGMLYRSIYGQHHRYHQYGQGWMKYWSSFRTPKFM